MAASRRSRVTVVTSDGYRASGHGDPRTASRVLALLDDFCSFLQSRLQSRNLPLLRCLCADAVCGRDETMTQFADFAAHLINVLPFEHDDQEATRPRAMYLLAKPKDDEEEVILLAHKVLAQFETRLVTKRATLLHIFLHEFGTHSDAAVALFVAQRCPAIAIVPLLRRGRHAGVQPTRRIASATTDEEAPTTTTTGDATHGDEEEEEVIKSASDSESDLNSDSNSNSEADSDSDPRRPSRRRPGFDPACRHRLMQLVTDCERRVPWRCFETPPLPFEEAQAPTLATLLRAFWVNHSQAVWERWFWKPFDPTIGDEALAQTKRKQYQRAATIEFQNVIYVAYDTFGVDFFLRLDARQPRHPGWWYRHRVVNLAALCRLIGESACVEYVVGQHRERFPRHMEGVRSSALASNAVGQRAVSASMWLVGGTAKATRMRAHICRARAEESSGHARS